MRVAVSMNFIKPQKNQEKILNNESITYKIKVNTPFYDIKSVDLHINKFTGKKH